MATRTFVISLSILTFGCSSNSGEEGGGVASGDCPDGQTLVVEGGEQVCGGLTEGSTLEPPEELAACGASAPNTSCSRDDFCAVEGCGSDGSMFDANGCRRKLCTEDADCDAGQVCYATDSETDGCLSTSDYACAPIDDDPCSCVANLICGEERHCIDE